MNGPVQPVQLHVGIPCSAYSSSSSALLGSRREAGPVCCHKTARTKRKLDYPRMNGVHMIRFIEIVIPLKAAKMSFLFVNLRELYNSATFMYTQNDLSDICLNIRIRASTRSMTNLSHSVCIDILLHPSRRTLKEYPTINKDQALMGDNSFLKCLVVSFRLRYLAVRFWRPDEHKIQIFAALCYLWTLGSRWSGNSQASIRSIPICCTCSQLGITVDNIRVVRIGPPRVLAVLDHT